MATLLRPGGQVLIEPWHVLESSIVFSNRWLRVRQDICRTNRGNVVDYYVTERNSYVMVVAVTPQAEVLVVTQYKHGVGQVIHELPAGYLEQGEDPALCAERELREETGYHSTHWERLGSYWAAPSSAPHSAYVFLARDVEHIGEQQWDANEMIQVERLPLGEAVRLALRNEFFHDLSSTLSLVLAWQRLHGPMLPATE